jgi:hypothetical protein
MAVKFFVAGNTNTYTRLFIGRGTQLYVYDNATPNPNLVGSLGPGSGIVLTLGPQSVTVALNEITGLVTLP